MEKRMITIPSGIKYMSDIPTENGEPFCLPHGIVSKGRTGCGGTTLALKDQRYNTIVCSPRIKLIENKHEQMPNTLMVTGDTHEWQIAEYLEMPGMKKILVTFDSLGKVLSQVTIDESWHIVVDEMQFVLQDATFKCDTELKMLQQLEGLPYVSYLSATPNYDRYLEQLSFFQELPYTELVWEEQEKTTLMRYKSNKPIKVAETLIKDYKNGDFPTMQTENGEECVSKELIVYVNSVKAIVNLVKNCDMQSEDVNIIVANKGDNEKAIKQLGEKFSMGRIPLEGEPHKLITLCTSTAYAGVDFMSTSALSLVVSDCKQSHTAVDIQTELIQIAGRQRLETNPFRNIILFAYNTVADDSSYDEYFEELERKVKITKKEISLFNSASEDEELRESLRKKLNAQKRVLNYDESFLTYDEKLGRFVCNDLAILAEAYNYNVQHEQYQSGIFVQQQLEKTGRFHIEGQQQWVPFHEVMEMHITCNSFTDKMKQYCELRAMNNPYTLWALQSIEHDNPSFKEYYDTLGPERIKANSFQESKMKNEYALMQKRSSLLTLVRERFQDGNRLPTAVIKQRLEEIYSSLGVTRKVMATDLRLFGFNVKEAKINIDGKRISGYQLTAMKEEETE